MPSEPSAVSDVGSCVPYTETHSPILHCGTNRNNRLGQAFWEGHLGSQALEAFTVQAVPNPHFAVSDSHLHYLPSVLCPPTGTLNVGTR